jgi:hypothetical protein
MKTIAFRVSIWLAGCSDALRDHAFGHVSVIRLFFFFFLAGHADRLMGVNRENSLIALVQFFAADSASLGTRQVLSPLIVHYGPPSSRSSQ